MDNSPRNLSAWVPSITNSALSHPCNFAASPASRIASISSRFSTQRDGADMGVPHQGPTYFCEGSGCYRNRSHTADSFLRILKQLLGRSESVYQCRQWRTEVSLVSSAACRERLTGNFANSIPRYVGMHSEDFIMERGWWMFHSFISKLALSVSFFSFW
jgi:hypothetical protein